MSCFFFLKELRYEWAVFNFFLIFLIFFLIFFSFQFLLLHLVIKRKKIFETILTIWKSHQFILNYKIYLFAMKKFCFMWRNLFCASHIALLARIESLKIIRSWSYVMAKSDVSYFRLSTRFCRFLYSGKRAWRVWVAAYGIIRPWYFKLCGNLWEMLMGVVKI